MLIDFDVIKPIITSICKSLNHGVIIPKKCKLLDISNDEEDNIKVIV